MDTSNDENPSHIYTDPGTYVAWLAVSDGHYEVAESITIIVDSVMDLSVQKLEFIFKCVHRSIPDTHSNRFRTPIPIDSGHVATVAPKSLGRGLTRRWMITVLDTREEVPSAKGKIVHAQNSRSPASES